MNNNSYVKEWLMYINLSTIDLEFQLPFEYLIFIVATVTSDFIMHCHIYITQLIELWHPYWLFRLMKPDLVWYFAFELEMVAYWRVNWGEFGLKLGLVWGFVETNDNRGQKVGTELHDIISWVWVLTWAAMPSRDLFLLKLFVIL